jgi:putative transposase
MSDHVHMLVSIPPKYSVAQIVGFLKGKSAISIARIYFGQEGIIFQQWEEMKQ